MKKMLVYAILITCLLLVACGQSANDDQADDGENGQAQNNEDNTGNEENEDENVDNEQNADGQNNNEGEGNDMDEIDVFDFENIGRAPETTEEHQMNEVIKVYFSQWTFDDPHEPVVINVADNKLYVNPSLSLQRFSTYDDVVQISDAKDVVDILEKYEVQEWERDYTFEDPDTYEDGYSWRLWLQFEDGSVEKHSGKGTDVDKLTPENFHAFAKELTEFVEGKLEEGE